MTASPSPSRPPEVPQRYALLEVLGAGRGAVVYRARDLERDGECAVKALQPHAHLDASALERVRRNVVRVAGLHHPNVADVLDVGFTYVVMELVEGSSLAAFIAEGALPPSAVASTVERVARAIAAAHQRDVVHGALTPSKVLVPPSGEPRLSGLGCAPDASATAKGNDVRALGAILYLGLTGQEPPPHDDAGIPGREPARHGLIAAGVPADLQTVTLRALAVQPKDAVGAEALVEGLGHWLAGRPLPVPERPAPHPFATAPRAAARPLDTRRVFAVGAAACVAAAIALAIGLPQFARQQRVVELWRLTVESLRDAEQDARRGDAAGARARLERGVARCRAFLTDDDAAEAHFALGRLYRAQGRLAEAEVALTAALAQRPRFAAASLERGRVRVRLRDTSPPAERKARRRAAIEDLVVPVAPNRYATAADVAFGRAQLAHLRDDHQVAIRELEHMLAADPRRAKAPVGRGRRAGAAGVAEAGYRAEAQALLQELMSTK
ncbi:MAG: protein kinase [Planctomycetota bacterium]